MPAKQEKSPSNRKELLPAWSREVQNNSISRRKLVRGGLVTGGALLAGLYLKPNFSSVGVPAAYAAISPVATPGTCLGNSPPTVEVIRPNGPSPELPAGEVWHFNTTERILWTADDADGVSGSNHLVVEIRYDANSGNDGYPYLISSGIFQTAGGEWFYDWDIGPYDPYLASSTSRIRVTVRDLCDAATSDNSDGDFCPPDPSYPEFWLEFHPQPRFGPCCFQFGVEMEVLWHLRQTEPVGDMTDVDGEPQPVC